MRTGSPVVAAVRAMPESSVRWSGENIAGSPLHVVEPVRELAPRAVGVLDLPLVKPGAGQRRRREEGRIHRLEALQAMQALRVVAGEGFAIELLDHAEAAEFALVAVPVALVVAIFGGELAAGEFVDHLDAGDDLHRKWKPAGPARRGPALVLDIEARGWCIFHEGTRAGVVIALV